LKFDFEKAIAWFNARKGRVFYSMINRNGPKSFDCSSAIYYALIEAGVFPSSIVIGNTDSLFGDLERHGFSRVQASLSGYVAARRGDIVLWGVRGQSGGSKGHVMLFVDAANIIHCSSGYNGIAISNHDMLNRLNGSPDITVYRFEAVQNPIDQIVEVGSHIAFSDVYTADDVQLINHVWQIKSLQLCKSGFTWDDNGIPASVLTEVDDAGFATADQEMAVGSKYKIPGKFIVQDVGQENGEWLAKVGAGIMSFWVNIETAREIPSDDPGTPTPSGRQDNVVLPQPSSALPIVIPAAPVVEDPKPVDHVVVPEEPAVPHEHSASPVETKPVPAAPVPDPAPQPAPSFREKHFNKQKLLTDLGAFGTAIGGIIAWAMGHHELLGTALSIIASLIFGGNRLGRK
jgi:hypothetical protein